MRSCCRGAEMVEVMLTTAPLFASAIAAKSGSVCSGAPAACTPAAFIPTDGAVTPCAAFPDMFACGSAVLEQPAARMTAESKQAERILAFMGHPGALD